MRRLAEKQITMRKRFFSILVIAFTSALGAFTADAPKKPNVIFIIVDDLNDSVDGYGGHPQARTPNIDRLANQGMKFTNAQSNCPICGPSRASLLTGVAPWKSGYFGFQQQKTHFRTLPALKNALTIMEYFDQSGYEVHGSGKIFHDGHYDNSVWQESDGKSHYGSQSTVGPVPSSGEKAHGWYLLSSGHPAMRTGLDQNWTTIVTPISVVPNVPPNPDQGIPGYKGWTELGKPWRYVSESDRDPLPDERHAKYAREVIQQRHGKPFLLLLGFNRPHTPLVAPDKYFEQYPLESIELPPYLENDMEDCAGILQDPQGQNFTGRYKYENRLLSGGVDAWKEFIRGYLACVSFVDDQIGAVLDELERSEYADNTIVILTSDHGYHLGEKDWLFKYSLWEEAARIPFIVKAPGITEPGAQCARPISLLDVYPTLIDLCDINHVKEEKQTRCKLDGHSIKPLLIDPVNGSFTGQNIALTAVWGGDRKERPETPADKEFQHYSARSEKFRYIYCSNGEEELYSHTEDPNEWKNLSDDPEFAAIKETMKRSILIETGLAVDKDIQ
jgi:arylsulfatase A-like enzyme